MSEQITADEILQFGQACDSYEGWKSACEMALTQLRLLQHAKPKTPAKAKAQFEPHLSRMEALAIYGELPPWFRKRKRAVFPQPRCVRVTFADGHEVLTSTYFRDPSNPDRPDIATIVRAERSSRIRRTCIERNIPLTTMLDNGATVRAYLCRIPDVVEAVEVPTPIFERVATLRLGYGEGGFVAGEGVQVEMF